VLLLTKPTACIDIDQRGIDAANGVRCSRISPTSDRSANENKE
jgi:hypothetical protein